MSPNFAASRRPFSCCCCCLVGVKVLTDDWSVTGLAWEVVLFLDRAADFRAADAVAFFPLEVVRLAEGAAAFLLLAEAGFAFAAVVFLCAEFDVVAILLVPFHEQRWSLVHGARRSCFNFCATTEYQSQPHLYSVTVALRPRFLNAWLKRMLNI